MKRESIQRLTLGGAMAALVFAMTWLPKIPVPATGGYVHLGDGMIFLSCMVLGPQAAAAAALGSALSDLVGGYMVYVPATFIIKGLMALLACRLYRPGSLMRILVSFVLAECVMVAGYFAFECALYGLPAALGAVGPNAVQGLAGVAVGLLCRPLVPRLKKVVH